jgi:hypothetical protein
VRTLLPGAVEPEQSAQDVDLDHADHVELKHNWCIGWSVVENCLGGVELAAVDLR